jgi:hypothetical protein
MELELFKNNASGAAFSDNRKHRFVLWRAWDESKPEVIFIGLNPSTANETKPDPTITRVVSFAKQWGFGSVTMLNLFTYVTAHPEELKKCNDPLLMADHYLKLYATDAEKIIFAWGKFKQAEERAKEVIAMFPNAYCLVKNKDGSPRHPLYVPGNTEPILFNN